MKQAGKLLFKSLVLPFYKANAGVLLFVLTIMCFIAHEPVSYHYSLILGTLKNHVVLGLVFFIWFLYAGKFTGFIITAINQPEYSFLQLLNCLAKTKRFVLFFVLELLLFLPVLLYAIIIVIIGVRQQFYLESAVTIIFLLIITIAATFIHMLELQNPHKKYYLIWERIPETRDFQSSYPFILLGFIANQQKLNWVGVKVFTCATVYFIGRNNTLINYDIKTAFLLFCFGVLANSFLILAIRKFEETYLAFYRAAPVKLLKRYFDYCFTYIILLLPEIITLILMVPVKLHVADAIGFILSSYGLVLLMSSITFAQDFKMKEYLKILLLIYFVQYFFLMTIGLFAGSILFVIAAVLIFWTGYYKFERVN
jgi:hypothetical protein